MKNKVKLFLSIVLTTVMSTTVFAETKGEVELKVYDVSNNRFMTFNNEKITLENITFFPMRELLNNLGVSNEYISYDSERKSISFSNTNYDVTFEIGSNEYVQNGVSFEMPVVPFVNYEGITYLPIRYVANSLGNRVDYNKSIKQIEVTEVSSNYVVYKESELVQFSDLEEGDILATLHTNYGDIVLRFFPEYAPLAVENFLQLAEVGYYDNVLFHRVINNFVIQGGDPTGTGFGGSSIYGENFEDETSVYLRHFTGALAMANAGKDTNGSQFYIVEAENFSSSEIEFLEYTKNNPLEVYENGYYIQDCMSPIIAEKYLELGGTPSLDSLYTVFGQVVEGMDVVHAIGKVETTESDKPIEDVIIENITIEKYK